MTLPAASRFVVRLWAVVLAAVAIIVVLVALAINASRGQHEEQETAEAWSMARVLESDLEEFFSNVNVALVMLDESWQRHLRGEADLAAVTLRAMQLKAAVPDIEAIRIADAEGVMVAGTDMAEGAPLNIADREYFARARDSRADEIVIGGPLVGRITGKEVIIFARRLQGPDGRFSGVAIAGIASARVTRTLGGAEIGAMGEVMLYNDRLRLLARHPAIAGPPGGASREPPAELRALATSGEAAGTFHYESPYDGIERVVSYRRLSRFPAHLTVARAPQEYLAHWRRDAAATLAVALLLVALAIGSAAMVHRAWRRQQIDSSRLSQLARTDELTGLANRRSFFEEAEAERARAVRYGSPVAVLMLDIDHFKEVNDTHGHRAGDLVLQQLARTSGDVLREVDVLGRVGGEEFAALLPETGLEAAMEVAERLRAAVENSGVARSEGLPLRVTISIGVAALEDEENLDTLMSRADTALYQAKHEGRNRVRVLAGPMPA